MYINDNVVYLTTSLTPIINFVNFVSILKSNFGIFVDLWSSIVRFKESVLIKYVGILIAFVYIVDYVDLFTHVYYVNFRFLSISSIFFIFFSIVYII